MDLWYTALAGFYSCTKTCNSRPLGCHQQNCQFMGRILSILDLLHPDLASHVPEHKLVRRKSGQACSGTLRQCSQRTLDAFTPGCLHWPGHAEGAIVFQNPLLPCHYTYVHPQGTEAVEEVIQSLRARGFQHHQVWQ